jgi:hypothetical protein
MVNTVNSKGTINLEIIQDFIAAFNGFYYICLRSVVTLMDLLIILFLGEIRSYQLFELVIPFSTLQQFLQIVLYQRIILRVRNSARALPYYL